MTQPIKTDIIIIGAGLSGLMAGHVLADAGKRVVLLDKGRSVGGRLATRRIGDDGLADHGAQFFTVRDAEFGSFVERWLADGLVYEWARGWNNGSITTNDGHPRYAVRGGMNALAKHLALGLETRLSVKVVAITALENGWQVEDENGATFQARALLLTPPVPQSLDLLDDGEVTLTSDQRRALDSLQYDPCLAGMFLLDGAIHLPAPGAIQRPEADLYWIADNQQKGISNATMLTAHAGAAYSRQLWDRSDADILNELSVKLLPLIGQTQIIESQLKRWRYAQPGSVYPERCLSANAVHAPLVFAGDAFGSPRIEGAALSGLAAGRALLEQFGQLA